MVQFRLGISLFWLLIEAISGALGVSLIMNLISVPIQRRWLAAVIFVLVMTLVLIPSRCKIASQERKNIDGGTMSPKQNNRILFQSVLPS